MFGKDMQLFYRQWQAHLDQGVAYWQAMMQTQAHSLEALLAVWSATTRLRVAPSPLLQSWTQAVAQWFEGYARVVSTALTGHDVTAHRQVAHLTEHVTELANITARLEQYLVSLSDLQARATPATDRLLQRLQDMQEALEQRLHTLDRTAARDGGQAHLAALTINHSASAAIAIAPDGPEAHTASVRSTPGMTYMADRRIPYAL